MNNKRDVKQKQTKKQSNSVKATDDTTNGGHPPRVSETILGVCTQKEIPVDPLSGLCAYFAGCRLWGLPTVLNVIRHEIFDDIWGTMIFDTF